MNKLAIAITQVTWTDLKKKFAEIVADRLDDGKVTYINYRQYVIMFWDEEPENMYSKGIWNKMIAFICTRKHAILTINSNSIFTDIKTEDIYGVDETFNNLLKYKTEIYTDTNGSMNIIT